MRPEMSPAEHHQCAAVLERVHDFLDRELSDGDEDAIRVHLSECEQCLDEYDIEQAIKAAVQRCCRGSAPEGLRDRVLHRLTAATRSHREAAEN